MSPVSVSLPFPPLWLALSANNAAIGVVALVAWVAIVGIVVWLGEKVVQKFRQRRTATPAGTCLWKAVNTERDGTRITGGERVKLGGGD
jgi:hypothetical protein